MWTIRELDPRETSFRKVHYAGLILTQDLLQNIASEVLQRRQWVVFSSETLPDRGPA
jgi:hypothetical protein